MRLNTSWQRKFLILILVTLFSLAIVTGSIFWGLQTVSASYEAAYQVSRYESSANRLATKWNAVEKQFSTLAEGDQAEMLVKLSELEAGARQLQNQANMLNDVESIRAAESIRNETKRYVTSRRQWLPQKTALGLSESAGLRLEHSDIMEAFQEMPLSLIDEIVDKINNNISNYINLYDPALAEASDQAITELETVVEEYNWQDIVIGENTRHYRDLFNRINALIKELSVTSKNAEQAGNNLQLQIIKQSEALQSGLVASSIKNAENAEKSATLISIGSMMLLGSLLVLALVVISRALVSQLNRIVDLLSQVANGDLTKKLILGSNPNDEFNILGKVTNQMIDNIGVLMRESIAGTHDLIEVHGELEKTMDRLTQNSEAVESQTILAAAASQQISVTLNDVAQRTSQVGVATQTANDSAQSGARIIEDSVTSLHQLSELIQKTHAHVGSLNQSSSKVTGIIGVINSLADQTNLLALNAAIEAARAGEAGRGFSVVAEEVRTLAQKTVAATTNIVAIIDELNSQTASMDTLVSNGLSIAKEGEHHASQIAQAMGGVTQSIHTLTQEMDQVVVAVEEISVTTDDIALKMEEIRNQTAQTQIIGNELGVQNLRLSEQAGVIEESTRHFNV